MYRRTSPEPGPSISICPRCHSPKDPNQSTCSICGARSCPNGHLLSETERICSKCNWVDRQMKPASTLYPSAKPSPKFDALSSQVICPVCNNKISAGATQCPYCGNLITSEFEQFGAAQTYTPPPTTNAPVRREAIIVHQETIGHHDTKRTYICPNCGNRIDDPTSGRCPYCGALGTMQYDITQKQPQWAEQAPPARPTFPPRQQFTQAATEFPQQQPAEVREPANYSICPNCGAANPLESRYCGSCGYKYGGGKRSQKVLTMSAADMGLAAASAGPELYAPIYADEAFGEMAEEVALPGKRRKAAPREKKPRHIKKETYGEHKFPLGLLMSIMIVAALIIALGIYVISREFRNPQPVSTEGPLISDVAFNTSADGSAIVTWVTDKASTSQIMLCDPAGLCTWTDPDTTLVTSHSVTVSNLKSDVQYHVTLKSIDQYGNEAQFETDRSFSGTVSSIVSYDDTTPPLISQVSVTDITDIGFRVTWLTDEPATSQVEYGESSSYGSSTAVDTDLTTDHEVVVTGLEADTTYYIKAVSTDAAGNIAADENSDTVQTATEIAEGIQVGNKAPDFELNDLSGNAVKLSSLRGKIVIVNFWGVDCIPCVAEMPYLQSVYTNWSGDAELEILAVNIWENLDRVQPHVNTYGYTFKVLIDNGTVESMYAISQIPTSYFIDTKGIIRKVRDTSFESATGITDILNTMD